MLKLFKVLELCDFQNVVIFRIMIGTFGVLYSEYL